MRTLKAVAIIVFSIKEVFHRSNMCRQRAESCVHLEIAGPPQCDVISAVLPVTRGTMYHQVAAPSQRN